MKKMMRAILAVLFAASIPAFGATLYVTPTGAGNKDGSSWANAFAGIQAAVDFVDAAVAADANYPIPTIHVADGTYSRVSITNDIALDVRYVYGIVPMTATTDINGRPLVGIKIDANGTPRFDLAPQKNTDDYGLKFSVIWSRTLSPWQTLGEIRFDADGDGNDNVCHPPINTSIEPRMFFKYRLVLENE